MTADTAGERLVVLQGQRLLRQKEKFIIFIAFGQFLLKFFVYFYIGLYEKTRFLFCDGDDAASQGAISRLLSAAMRCGLSPYASV